MSAFHVWFFRLAVGVTFFLPLITSANGPPPFPIPPDTVGRVEAKIVVVDDVLEEIKKGAAAKIVIPMDLIREELKKIAAKENGEEPAAPTAKPQRNSNLPNPSQRGETPLRTIVAGLAMSLAAVSLVFVVRKQSAAARNGAMLVAGLIVAGAAATAWADVAPRRNRPPFQPRQPGVEKGEKTVIIEFTSGGHPRNDTVRVLLAEPQAPEGEPATPQKPALR